MIGIYRIENITNGDCYVGSSKKLNKRKNRHFKDLNNQIHHSIILQRAYNKYGRESFNFIIVEECLLEELLEKEQYWIDTLSPKYNIAKIAGSNLGVIQSNEANQKRRDWALENNIKPPESTWKDKQESVLMLDYSTLEILNSFKSISEACRFIGKDCTFVSTISSCCKNKRYSAFGYRWVFKEEDIVNLRTKKEVIPWNKGKKVDNHKAKKVYQYSLNNEFIKEWDSVKKAEESIGKKGISNCALGKSKTSNGFIWSYELK